MYSKWKCHVMLKNSHKVDQNYIWSSKNLLNDWITVVFKSLNALLYLKEHFKHDFCLLITKTDFITFIIQL